MTQWATTASWKLFRLMDKILLFWQTLLPSQDKNGPHTQPGERQDGWDWAWQPSFWLFLSARCSAYSISYYQSPPCSPPPPPPGSPKVNLPRLFTMPRYDLRWFINCYYPACLFRRGILDESCGSDSDRRTRPSFPSLPFPSLMPFVSQGGGTDTDTEICHIRFSCYCFSRLTRSIRLRPRLSQPRLTWRKTEPSPPCCLVEVGPASWSVVQRSVMVACSAAEPESQQQASSPGAPQTGARTRLPKPDRGSALILTDIACVCEFVG